MVETRAAVGVDHGVTRATASRWRALCPDSAGEMVVRVLDSDMGELNHRGFQSSEVLWSRLWASNPKVNEIRWRWRISGDSGLHVTTLSSAAHARLHRHGRITTTSTFALTEVRAAGKPTGPPSLSTGVFHAFVRMHRLLTSMGSALRLVDGGCAVRPHGRRGW